LVDTIHDKDKLRGVGGTYWFEDRPEGAKWCPYCLVAYRLIYNHKYSREDLIPDSYAAIEREFKEDIHRSDEHREEIRRRLKMEAEQAINNRDDAAYAQTVLEK
jgi:hypothetical protein